MASKCGAEVLEAEFLESGDVGKLRHALGRRDCDDADIARLVQTDRGGEVHEHQASTTIRVATRMIIDGSSRYEFSGRGCPEPGLRRVVPLRPQLLAGAA
jgi:hypothetical protein